MTVSQGVSSSSYFNKSSVTNLLSLGVFLLGYSIEWSYAGLLKSIGLFALSGAFTNWIAIHMLFEKVPGFYGSGVIPNRFQEFKIGIKKIMMEQFFNQQNIDNFFKQNQDEQTGKLDFSELIEGFDYEILFAKLLQSVKESPLGPMLAMMGGDQALAGVKDPFVAKMKEALAELVDHPHTQTLIRNAISHKLHSQDILHKVEDIVEQRLAELTPQLVKEIIQEMIKNHLGWLVIWGGVFGGLLGAVAYYVA